jgi:hypothetical protein
MAVRLLLASTFVLALVLLPPGSVRAQDDICDEELRRFESIANVVVIDDPQQEDHVQQLWETTRQACAEGDIEAATASLTEAWTILLEDTELTVPAPEEVASQPCTRGIQNVQARAADAQISDFARDAANTLVVRAQQLCDEDRPADAQNKLAMAWSMLEQDEN